MEADVKDGLVAILVGETLGSNSEIDAAVNIVEVDTLSAKLAIDSVEPDEEHEVDENEVGECFETTVLVDFCFLFRHVLVEQSHAQQVHDHRKQHNLS